MIATPLSDVQPPGPRHQPKPGFEALWRGQRVIVTAVLELTAVVTLAPGVRHLARKADVLVDPAELSWCEVVDPRHRGRLRALDSPEVRRARASQGADMGAVTSGYHRYSPAEAGRARLTGACSGCGRGIQPSNAKGVCAACRRRCGCGGPKSRDSAMCRGCWAQERSQGLRGGEG